jgi:lysophospholipase L1-like esterase
MLRAVAKTVVRVAALLALVAPSAPAAERYVALGDSFSSGTGTGTYDLDGNCQRSRYAYPALVAERRSSLKLVFAACAGATTDDVLLTQASRLNRATRLVTITIGGNDVRFSDVFSACVQGGPAACGAAISGAQQSIRTALPGDLDAVYAKIRTRAPAARVIVLGYPRLFSGAGCQAISREHVTRLNRTASLLRDTVRQRVKAAGRRFSFRDAIPAFGGHGICARSAWINGLLSPIVESYHPNRAGHSRGYAPLVLRALRARSSP